MDLVVPATTELLPLEFRVFVDKATEEFKANGAAASLDFEDVALKALDVFDSDARLRNLRLVRGASEYAVLVTDAEGEIDTYASAEMADRLFLRTVGVLAFA